MRRLLTEGNLITRLLDKAIDGYLHIRASVLGPVDVTVGETAKLRLDLREPLARKMYRREYEPLELMFLKTYLTPGDVFFDIGANIGLFTVIAAERVGTEGRVHAFEPGYEAFDVLTRNIELNGYSNIVANRCALSAQPESLTLYMVKRGLGAFNSFAQSSAELCKEPTEHVSVNCITLDDYVQKLNGDRINLIKIDVEGWEMNVLQGSRNVLAGLNAPALIVEFDTVLQKNAGFTCEQLWRFLVDLDYTFYSLRPGKKRSCKLILEKGLRHSYSAVNLVATKDVQYLQKRLA